jgi:hypothetical protein
LAVWPLVVRGCRLAANIGMSRYVDSLQTGVDGLGCAVYPWGNFRRRHSGIEQLCELLLFSRRPTSAGRLWFRHFRPADAPDPSVTRIDDSGGFAAHRLIISLCSLPASNQNQPPKRGHRRCDLGEDAARPISAVRHN